MSSSSISQVVDSILESEEAHDIESQFVEQYEGGRLDEESVDIRYERDSSYEGSEDHSGDYFEPEVENEEYKSIERFLEGIETTGRNEEVREVAVDKDEKKARIVYANSVIDYEIIEQEELRSENSESFEEGNVFLYKREENQVGGAKITNNSLIELNDGDIMANYVGNQEVSVYPSQYNVELITGAFADLFNAEDRAETAIMSSSGEYVFEFGDSLNRQLGRKDDAEPDIDRGTAEKLVEEIKDEDGVIQGRIDNLELVDGIQELVQSKSDDNLKSLPSVGVGVFEEKNIGKKEDRLYVANGSQFEELDDKVMYGLKVSVNKNGHQQEIIEELQLEDIEELV